MKPQTFNRTDRKKEKPSKQEKVYNAMQKAATRAENVKKALAVKVA